MLRTARVCSTVVLTVLASCNRAAKTGSPSPEAELRPLAGFVVQRIVVTPTALVRSADSLGWVQRLGGAKSVARRLDTSIVAALTDRGLGQRWILPVDVARSYERNRSYAADPYSLSVEPLRARSLDVGAKVGEPLASQLRTMIALHEDARFVFLPIELRFERDGATGRAVLRAVLVDPRFAETKWVGDVKGDAASTPELALASVAARIADLFVAP